jgi:hypothetical protein
MVFKPMPTSAPTPVVVALLSAHSTYPGLAFYFRCAEAVATVSGWIGFFDDSVVFGTADVADVVKKSVCVASARRGAVSFDGLLLDDTAYFGDTAIVVYEATETRQGWFINLSVDDTRHFDTADLNPEAGRIFIDAGLFPR